MHVSRFAAECACIKRSKPLKAMCHILPPKLARESVWHVAFLPTGQLSLKSSLVPLAPLFSAKGNSPTSSPATPRRLVLVLRPVDQRHRHPLLPPELHRRPGQRKGWCSIRMWQTAFVQGRAPPVVCSPCSSAIAPHEATPPPSVASVAGSEATARPSSLPLRKLRASHSPRVARGARPKADKARSHAVVAPVLTDNDRTQRLVRAISPCLDATD
jgi:hypothetical protein